MEIVQNYDKHLTCGLVLCHAQYVPLHSLALSTYEIVGTVRTALQIACNQKLEYFEIVACRLTLGEDGLYLPVVSTAAFDCLVASAQTLAVPR